MKDNAERKYISLGPVYEFVCDSFRTGNLNCFIGRKNSVTIQYGHWKEKFV